ncbi:ABC transporter substrate-binding protein [bacterium]|nr:MAG: ABC transporter substrate-binding protein [bacterium]
MALVGLALAGCGSSSSTTEGGTSGTTTNSGEKKNFKLAFVTNNSSAFWKIAEKGVQKADEELANVEVEFRMPGEGTAAAQKTVVDDMLAKGIDGMAISPVDPANQTDLLNEAAKKTLLLTQDSDAPNSERACYIGTDNKAAGKQLGEELKKALPDGGKVMIFVGKLDAQNAQDRIAGIEEAIAGTKIQIVDKRTDDTDRVRAKSNVSDALVKTPDIKALVGIWSYNGPAILSAVEDAKKTGQVKILCFDEEDETLRGVEEGKIDVTIVQQPYKFGYESVKTMEKYLSGDKSAIPDSKMNIIPTLVITKGEVAKFKEDLAKLRA